MASSLVGKRILVRGNEFEDKDLPAMIVVVDEEKQKLLLELDEPLINRSTTYRHVVASPRLRKDSIDLLVSGGILGCTVTWVPDEKYNSSAPTDLSWWRGGGAAITDLQIIIKGDGGI